MSDPQLIIVVPRRGRPRLESARVSTVSAKIQTSHHDALVKMAGRRSISSFLADIVANVVERGNLGIQKIQR